MEENKNRILTELPRKEGFGKNKNKKVFDCQAMVGMKLELEYEQNIYIVEIIDYISARNPRFKIEYNGEIKEIACGSFMAGNFGGILNKITKSFKIKIGDEIKDNKRDIVITDREYRETKHANGKYVINDKWYKYRCNKCGWDEGWIVEGALLKQKQGCSCCSNRTVVKNINSIWTTNRWMCDLGLSVEDAKTHTKCSNDKVFVICPNCNKKKEIRISDIYKHKSIFCSCGGRGVSYPEKFMMNVLDQLNIEYIFQLTKNTFDWCGNKKYDFYIPLTKSVLETHGMQHYKWTGRGRTLEEEQENDRIKYELALQNGIKEEEYVVIDCRYSDKEYIKNNILKSKLNKLFDLSKVDWEKCEEFALCNLVKSVCDYWNGKKDWETTTDLGKIFRVDRTTIIDYLKKGTELGWCNYNTKEEIEKNGKRSGSTNGKVVAMYDLDGNFIMKESSAVKLKERCLKELNIDLDTGNISKVCLGKRKAHQKHIFKYID